jgi:hypothetical protein
MTPNGQPILTTPNSHTQRGHVINVETVKPKPLAKPLLLPSSAPILNVATDHYAIRESYLLERRQHTIFLREFLQHLIVKSHLQAHTVNQKRKTEVANQESKKQKL